MRKRIENEEKMGERIVPGKCREKMWGGDVGKTRVLKKMVGSNVQCTAYRIECRKNLPV